MSDRKQQIQKLCSDGARRLLTRAEDNYGVTEDVIRVRIEKAVEKYLLKDDENVSSQEIQDFLEGLQASDLCLIVACEQGVERAWTDLVERFATTVRSAARSASSNEETAEDLAQSIWAELHGLRMRDDGRPTGKLAYYSGRGSLAGWLRAVVGQLAIDQHRKQSRLVQTEEDSDFDRILADGSDSPTVTMSPTNPELAASQKFAGAEMQKALSRSIQELNDEDRLLVKLYYFDNLRLREAGAVLGVHEATASRRLTRIHSELRQEVEKILVCEKGWTKSETERAFSELALHMETDIEPLLAKSGVLMNKENEIAS